MPEPETNWKYTPEQADQAIASPKAEKAKKPSSFSWTSTPGMANRKKPTWYFMLTLITVVIAGLIYILTKDKISTVAVVICGVLLAVYGFRKPKEIKYSINDVGFTIGDREYAFSQYKSYSVTDNGVFLIIAMTPLKRFMPYLYVSLTKDDETKVTQLINQNLPLEKTKTDPIDKLLHYIGF